MRTEGDKKGAKVQKLAKNEVTSSETGKNITAPTWNRDLNFSKWGPNGDLILSEMGTKGDLRQQKWGPNGDLVPIWSRRKFLKPVFVITSNQMVDIR